MEPAYSQNDERDSSASSLKKENNNDKNAKEYILKRFSNHLVIGICGYVGSGFRSFVEELDSAFKYHKFHVEIIRISGLIKEITEKTDLYGEELNSIGEDKAKRYLAYQKQGNLIRKTFGDDFLAKAAISKIEESQIKFKDDNHINLKEKIFYKHVYIIDQLKHDKEVELFRLVYPHNYFQFSLIRNEDERKNNLKDEGISIKNAESILHADKSSIEQYGQKTQKAILEGDFFIHNRHGNKSKQRQSILRSIDLILGKNGLTPTIDEKGMYSAFSASLNSACLSRQVGAALLNDDGDILATGRNDVPKAFGGLYSTNADTSNDHRCIFRGGHCYNDSHKKMIKNKIIGILDAEKMNGVDTKKLADKIFKETPLSSIIEYSRAVHAEMDVITSLARNSGETTKNKILYSTTYPCHNCARHILSSGIKRVVYIEPYDKSLATQYHDDAITDRNENNKIIFEQFEGVSPKRYQIFFLLTGERKNKDGSARLYTNKYGNYVDNQPLDDTNHYQLAIYKDFTDKLEAQNI